MLSGQMHVLSFSVNLISRHHTKLDDTCKKPTPRSNGLRQHVLYSHNGDGGGSSETRLRLSMTHPALPPPHFVPRRDVSGTPPERENPPRPSATPPKRGPSPNGSQLQWSPPRRGARRPGWVRSAGGDSAPCSFIPLKSERPWIHCFARSSRATGMIKFMP